MAVKFTLDTKYFDDFAEKLEELGGSDLIKQAVESGMKAAKAKINEDIKKALIKPNMPQNGKYSTGRAKHAIDKNFKVDKDGTIYSILAGFNWDDRNIGLGTQVMIYGTPSQEPIKGLKEAIYGAKARRHVKKEVQQAIDKIIERTLNK